MDIERIKVHVAEGETVVDREFTVEPVESAQEYLNRLAIKRFGYIRNPKLYYDKCDIIVKFRGRVDPIRFRYDLGSDTDLMNIVSRFLSPVRDVFTTEIEEFNRTHKDHEIVYNNEGLYLYRISTGGRANNIPEAVLKWPITIDDYEKLVEKANTSINKSVQPMNLREKVEEFNRTHKDYSMSYRPSGIYLYEVYSTGLKIPQTVLGFPVNVDEFDQLIKQVDKEIEKEMKGPAQWNMNKYGHITLTFPDGKDIYMQSEDDVMAFLQHVGISWEDASQGYNYDLDDQLYDDYYGAIDDSYHYMDVTGNPPSTMDNETFRRKSGKETQWVIADASNGRMYGGVFREDPKGPEAQRHLDNVRRETKNPWYQIMRFEQAEEIARVAGGKPSYEQKLRSSGALYNDQVSGSEIQMFLKGVNYPAGRRDLENAAWRNGAPEPIQRKIELLPGIQYNSPSDVLREFGRL